MNRRSVEVKTKDAHPKLQALQATFDGMGSVIVAYSGGVDSALVAAAANDVLGGKSLAVTARSPSLAPSDLRDAISVAERLELNHRVIDTGEVHRADYQLNDPNRCYFCKEELYTHLAEIAAQEGYDYIANGHNVDDQGDFRPGMNSARRRGVRSPLIEAELGKAEVRAISKARGLPTWDRPAAACLSSRIPYGTPVTVEALTRIAKAEEYLRGLGFKQLRVRHHDTVARIEVGADDFGRMMGLEVRKAVTEHFRSIGYAYVALDLDGFRSGSLNEVLAGLARKNGSADFQNDD